MSGNTVLWIAGPISFQTQTNLVAVNRLGDLVERVVALRWIFVGCTAAGDLRRWSLRVALEDRKFTANSLDISKWERAHQQRVLNLYRPAGILRGDLPKGDLATKRRSPKCFALRFRVAKHG